MLIVDLLGFRGVVVAQRQTSEASVLGAWQQRGEVHRAQAKDYSLEVIRDPVGERPPFWNEPEPPEDPFGEVIQIARRLVGSFVGYPPEVAAEEDGPQTDEEWGEHVLFVRDAQTRGVSVAGECMGGGAGVDLRNDARGVGGDLVLDRRATDVREEFSERDRALVQPLSGYVELPKHVVVGAA